MTTLDLDPEPLPWPGYQAAIDCWLCDGQFDPPCPFHPDATPAEVLKAGLWRFVTALTWCRPRRTL